MLFTSNTFLKGHVLSALLTLGAHMIIFQPPQKKQHTDDSPSQVSLLIPATEALNVM